MEQKNLDNLNNIRDLMLDTQSTIDEVLTKLRIDKAHEIEQANSEGLVLPNYQALENYIKERWPVLFEGQEPDLTIYQETIYDSEGVVPGRILRSYRNAVAHAYDCRVCNGIVRANLQVVHFNSIAFLSGEAGKVYVCEVCDSILGKKVDRIA